MAWGRDWLRWADLDQAGLSLCRVDEAHLLGSCSLPGVLGSGRPTGDLKMQSTRGCAALFSLLPLQGKHQKWWSLEAERGARQTVGAQDTLQPFFPYIRV